MQRHDDNLASRINGNGLQPLSGISVTVTDDATSLPASLYSDDGATPLAQPLTTDDNGGYGFYTANGEYTLAFSGLRIAPFTRKLIMADPSDNPHATLAQMAAPSGSALVGHIASAAGAVVTTVQAEIRKLDTLLTQDTAAVAILDGTIGGIPVVPSNLRNWRKAIANVRTGAGLARVACIGDSNTMGRGAGTGVNFMGGARAKSYPTYLAAILDKTIGANANNLFGSGNVVSPLTEGYDPRLSLASGWSVSGLTSLGGGMYTNSTNTNAMSFTPGEAVDTFDVYYLKNGGLATFTLDVDGGSVLATINSDANGNPSPGTLRATVSASLGTHTLNIKRNGTGAALYIIGVDAYNSAARKVQVLNMGASGWTANDWIQSPQPFSPLNALAASTPSLSIISLGLNDARTDADTSAFQGRMQTLITTAKGLGDVILVVPHRPDPSWNTTARFDVIRAAYYALAASNSLPLIDFSLRMTYVDYNTLGFYTDAAHPNSLGYFDKAGAIANCLLRP